MREEAKDAMCGRGDTMTPHTHTLLPPPNFEITVNTVISANANTENGHIQCMPALKCY